MNYFKFKPLHKNDLHLLYQWFQEPTINQWYARGKDWSLNEIKEKYEPRLSGKEYIPSFIVYKADVPVGFIQYYLLERNLSEGIQDSHNLLFKQYNQNELAGIDLFIATEAMRGKGLGKKVINQFIEEFLGKFAAVVVDPEVNNIAALRCYEKAGFQRTTFSENPYYFLMVKSLSFPLSNRMINSDLLQKVKELLQAYFATEQEISSVIFLSEPERRNIILRIKFKSTGDALPKSVILKQSLPEQSDRDDEDAYARFARDWAGLEFLSSIPQRVHNVPRFFGASKKHRFILIEDLGEHHISLVDSLTLPNKNKAISALSRFMKALGSFHAATFGHTEGYEKIVREINEKTESFEEDIEFILGDLLPKLKSANEHLGLCITPELIQEATDVITTMLNPGPFTVLTHGDICPDNVFDHEGQDLQLIDFEWACVRNALLDGTYLRMSMPTCWCAKAIPNDIIESMEQIYREELKKSIPAASDDLAYTAAYTKACGFWLLQQTLPYLEGILLQDRIGPSGPVPESSLWRAEENTVRPRFLSRLQSFIKIASKYDQLPHLREMAVNMLVVAKIRWPDAEFLEFYSAFK